MIKSPAQYWAETDRRAALSSSPSVARASDVRRARVAGRKQRGGDWQVGHGTVSDGGAADRWVRPETETEWPSPDE
jgi:hypothetical protein